DPQNGWQYQTDGAARRRSSEPQATLWANPATTLASNGHIQSPVQARSHQRRSISDQRRSPILHCSRR
ncbi:hypothetical protein, partial [Scytonema sp. PCC 10023]|uniref:hypothetical protein n=1 Tax=Scytonema sp. PCC 10023 TaxID=1680591 RepID=UPI0039C6F314